LSKAVNPAAKTPAGLLANEDCPDGQWRVHTPHLLEEILKNPGAGILRIPIKIFGELLFKVGERAAALNDPELNALMARLTIYSMADIESPDYDADALREVLAAGRRPVPRRQAPR
jgi:hypothetical protein